MKEKIVATLGVLGVTACLLLLAPRYADPQRGDLYGTRALLALEQAFKTTGVLTFPNYAAAPVTCNAANRGVYYYDTTLGSALVCGAAGWIASGLTVGTANTIVKFNAGATDLADSLMTDDAADVTLSSGQLLLPDGVVGAPAWSFTSQATTGAFYSGSAIRLTIGGSETFTIAGNQVQGLSGTAVTAFYNFGRVSGDTNTGMYRIGADQLGFTAGGALVQAIDATNAAGAGADLVTISSTLGIMADAGDIVRAMYIDLASVDHTGGEIFGIDFDTFVADTNSYEAPVRLPADWDTHLLLQSMTAVPADDPLTAGAVALYVDDNADYSGGGGNDCAFVARVVGGAVATIGIIVLNGACP